MKKLPDKEREEHRKKTVAKWKEKNAEQILEYQRTYRQANREKINALAAEWRKKKGIQPRVKKPAKKRPSIEELSKLFKNPDAAAHFRWLAENRK